MTTNLILRLTENQFGKWFGWVVYAPGGTTTSVTVNYSAALDTAGEALEWATQAREEYRGEFPDAEVPVTTDAGRAFRLRVDMAYRHAETGAY